MSDRMEGGCLCQAVRFEVEPFINCFAFARIVRLLGKS